MDILSPLVRIGLRYLSGILIAKGYSVNPDLFTDPDVVSIACFGAGGLCAIVSEGWYTIARRRGWGC